jgi:hypothetical protein
MRTASLLGFTLAVLLIGEPAPTQDPLVPSGADRAIKQAIDTLKQNKAMVKSDAERARLDRAIVGLEALLAKGKTYTRAQVRTLILGKTQDEVLRLLDRPDRTLDGDKKVTSDLWDYYNIRVLDTISGKYDRGFTIRFSPLRRLTAEDITFVP